MPGSLRQDRPAGGRVGALDLAPAWETVSGTATSPRAPTDTGLTDTGPRQAAGTSSTLMTDDGQELHVLVDGSAGTGLTLVFCHGLSLSLDCWENQRRAFAGRAGVVLYDQRGHGRSGRCLPGTATMRRLGEDLRLVLEEVVPPGRVILVGHSMGGMAIMALARRHPELFGRRIAGVALLSTAAGGLAGLTFGLPAYGASLLRPFVPTALRLLCAGGSGGLWGGLWRSLCGVCGLHRGATAGRGHHTFDALLRALVLHYSFASAVPTEVRGAAARIIRSASVGVVRDFYPALMAHDEFAALAVLRAVPTLIMVGEGDLVTPAPHSAAIAAALPSAEFAVLPGTGHAVMLERPLSVNTALGRLMRRVPREGARPERSAREPAARDVAVAC
ncbi:alpha/beta hydrolase [Microbispora sp. ZYX-F-249]|uniref:Alpha/beta hydrolase n=1 Tax=Microbispora maris TaxID=3144104 RepID=A0ABV0AHD8_9ACTN